MSIQRRDAGIEGQLGIGGGIVSKESQENLIKAEQLCQRGKPEQAVPYLTKALKDQNNLDAMIQCAFLAPTLNDSCECLDVAENRGVKQLKQRLGTRCFDDDGSYLGKFYDIIAARPYLRVLQAQVRLCFMNKEYNKAADAAIKTLRLCDRNQMGQSLSLPSLLVHANRSADALSFLQAWLTPSALDNDLVLHNGVKFDTPSNIPLSASHLRKMSNNAHPTFVYGAALAAFKLWGDCTLARQYLKVSCEGNPAILIKILGRVKQPSDQNNNPRMLGGRTREDTQDYLYLAQSLWMEPDVWEWANSDADVQKVVKRICCYEDCQQLESTPNEFKRCGGCAEVWYCGVVCQKADWRSHKPECLKRKELKALQKDARKGANSKNPLVFSAIDGVLKQGGKDVPLSQPPTKQGI